MGESFLKLLNMSITAGWFILAVLCIRLIFRKIPKWVNCLLWGAAALRLICPFSIESPFSILPSAEPIKSSTIVEGEIRDYIPSIDSHLTIVENTINPMLTEAFAYNESESVAPLQVVTSAAGFVWVCGMILLIICAAGGTIRLHKLVREAVCVRDNIYICDVVKSPFILGIARPRVYLSSALSEKEISYIIAHESAHLKRKDHWWKPLGYLLLCIYWFNPLCWVAYAMLCKDIELACDEKVARDMTFHEKKEYSEILLSCTKQRSLVMVCPLAFGEVGVKERVKSVLNYKKPALWIMIAVAVVCVILAICFLTNPAKEYQIRITIPAGSTEAICYSDAEISPKGNTLTIYAGEGLGDTEIKLLPVEAREENAYDEPVYITPGMPVKMDVERGAWFKIGVNIQNPTDESIDVYVSVDNVEVRIADRPENYQEGSGRKEIFSDKSDRIVAEINGVPVSAFEVELKRYLSSANIKYYESAPQNLSGQMSDEDPSDDMAILNEIAKERFLLESAKTAGIDISYDEIMKEIREEEEYVESEAARGNELMIQRQKEDGEFLAALGMTKDEFNKEIYAAVLLYNKTFLEYGKYYYTSSLSQGMTFEEYLDQEFDKADITIVPYNDVKD